MLDRKVVYILLYISVRILILPNFRFLSLHPYFTKFAAKFHTYTHIHFYSSSFIVTLSLTGRITCARAHFSGCSSTTNAHSETGQMAVCCQNLTLGALCSRSALSELLGAQFKKFGLFLNTPHIYIYIYIYIFFPCGNL